MSKIDDLYHFRLADVADIDDIMSFIKKEWNENHILAVNRDFFCYQHLNGDQVNYTLAVNRKNHCIEAIEGFIQYSEKLIDIAPVMWKTSNLSQTPFLGIELCKRAKILTNCRFYGSPGANPRTAIPLVSRMLKHATGKMKHFYRLGHVDSYKIAIINRVPDICQSGQSQYKLRPISDIQEIDGRFDFDSGINRIPFKDKWYVNRRYFEHPVYQYLVFGIENNGKIEALLICREVCANGSKIIRIVDFLGNDNTLAHISDEVNRLLMEGGYEYIDFYCKGIDDRLLIQSGFTLKNDDINIIPNYFDPFVQKNIDIWYNLSLDKAYVFKADGDQDRPNKS